MTEQRTEPVQNGKKFTWIAMIMLFVIPFLYYSPALKYGFLIDWDDGVFVLQNKHLDLSWENFRFFLMEPFQDLCTPIPFWTYMTDKACFGLEPAAFHLHNILVHIAAGIFFYLALTEAGIRKGYALAAALFWSCHPQRIESAVWIAERKDVWCAFFTFSALWTFFRDIRRDRIPVFAGILGSLSFLCKPAAAALPCVMILLTFLMKGKTISWKRYIALLAFPVLLQFAVLGFSASVTMHTNPGKLCADLSAPFVNFCRYIYQTAIPGGLTPVYPPGWRIGEVLPALAGSILIAGGLIFGARKAGISWIHILTGFLIFAGTAFPVLGFWAYVDFDYCDRYSLILSAPLIGYAAYILSRLELNRKAVLSAFLVLFCLHIFSGTVYMQFWNDTENVMYYALTQNSRASLSAVTAGASSALRNRNLPLLREAADSMKRNRLELASKRNPLPVIDGGESFLRERIAWMENREKEYVHHTLQTWKYFQKSNGMFCWPDYDEMFCEDLIHACRATGQHQCAEDLERKLRMKQAMKKAGGTR